MNYNSLLKFLYFEGYADSYEEAEYLLEELSDDEFDALCEKYVKAMNTTDRGPDQRRQAVEGTRFTEELSSQEKNRRRSTLNKITFFPLSRERNIGHHNDWNDPDPNTTDWGERSPAAKKLASRLSSVVQTQRRQDTEVGLREENRRDEYLRKRGETSKDAAMRKSRERRGRFSSGETHSDAERENITWTRPGTRSYDDSLNRQRKSAHNKARGRKKPRPGTSSEQRRLDAIWQSRFPEDRPRGRMEKLTPQQVKQQKQGVLRKGERRRELRGQAVRALRRVGINVTESLVEYLITNNITDCSQSALNILESMSDAWFYEILNEANYQGLNTARLMRRALTIRSNADSEETLSSHPNLNQRQRNAMKKRSKSNNARLQKMIDIISSHDPEKVQAKEKENRSTINVTPIRPQLG